MKIRMVVIVAILFLILYGCLTEESTRNGNVDLIVSAAASLKNVLDEIKVAYEKDHKEVTIHFNYGSSGSLRQQISEGAPVDLFFSAAEDQFNKLVEEGKIAEEDGVDLLGNSLVLIVPKGESRINSIEDLKKEEVNYISIGMVETVPAGKYSNEALESMQLWDEIEPKIVYAKDVTQVLTYVETKNVEAGIVYQTDATSSSKVDIVEEFVKSSHSPIIYKVGIIKNRENYEAAKDFYEYLQSDVAKKVFEEYGFSIQ